MKASTVGSNTEDMKKWPVVSENCIFQNNFIENKKCCRSVRCPAEKLGKSTPWAKEKEFKECLEGVLFLKSSKIQRCIKVRRG